MGSILLSSLIWEWRSFELADSNSADLFLRSICLAFSAILGILGCVHFIDWIIYRFTANPKKMIIRFQEVATREESHAIEAWQQQTQRRNGKFWFSLVAMALLGGTAIALFVAAYPIQPYLLAMIYALSIEGQKILAIAYLFIYHVILLLPLIAVFAIFLLTNPREKIILFAQRYISKVKVLLAAFLCAISYGLFYLFY